MTPTQMTDAAQVRNFISGGNATVTLVSRATGTRYTYKVMMGKLADGSKAPDVTRRFVKYLVGQNNETDYRYLGMMPNVHHNFLNIVATRASGDLNGSKPFRAFAYMLAHLEKGQIPEQLEIWHEGRCCRCGRKLTVPTSIASGIGPECATKV